MADPRSRGKKLNLSQILYSRQKSVDAFNSVDVLPNPDPVLNDFSRIRTWQNFRDIFWDPHLTAIINTRKAPTLAKKYIIAPEKSAARVRKLVEAAIMGLDVQRATSEIIDARFFGMQPMEPVWGEPKRFEGENKIFPLEFIGRPLWWFQYDKENKPRFRSTNNSWPGEEIEERTLIIARNDPKYENPYGDALLSKIYWSINFKKAAFKHWVLFTEKYGSPIAVGKPPRNASDNEFSELLDRLKELTKGSQVVIPSDATIEFIANASKGNAEVFKGICDFSNAEMSKCILGQTLTTEAGDKGARALGQVHNEVRLDLAESDENLVEDCFNILIRWIVDKNFGENVEAPSFKFEHEEDLKGDLAERDVQLQKLGVEFTPEYFMENYNLTEKQFALKKIEEPDPDKDDEFGEGDEFEDQAAVDKFIESITDKELQKQAGFIKPIIKMILKSGSYEEASEKLVGLMNDIRPLELEKELSKALLNTHNIGLGGDGT